MGRACSKHCFLWQEEKSHCGEIQCRAIHLVQMKCMTCPCPSRTVPTSPVRLPSQARAVCVHFARLGGACRHEVSKCAAVFPTLLCTHGGLVAAAAGARATACLERLRVCVCSAALRRARQLTRASGAQTLVAGDRVDAVDTEHGGPGRSIRFHETRGQSAACR